MLKAIQRKIGLHEEKKENKDTLALYEQPKKDKGKAIPSYKRGGGEPSYVYQADTLYMPMDKGYKYLLVVVDVVDGKTDAEPMKDRNAQSALKAFKKIFSRGILAMPQYQLQADVGTEFKNATIQGYFAENNVTIKWGKVDRSSRSRNQARVESRNRIISQALFQKQTTKELVSGKENRKWVDDVRKVIDAINEHETEHWNKTKKKREKLPDQTHIPKNTTVIEVGTKVRTKLDKPKSATGAKLGGYAFRATDIKWDPKIKTVTNIMFPPNQPILYQVDNE